jgi:hypothetical protein
MKFLPLLSLLVLANDAMARVVPVRRQGDNLVYQGNESVMTAAVSVGDRGEGDERRRHPYIQSHHFTLPSQYNVTYHLLPITKADATKLAGNRKLLTPTDLPAGYLKNDEHVLFVSDGYMSDIRMMDLRVDRLKTTVIQVPFVDQLNDGKTAFKLTAYTYQDQLIPALVGSLTQGFTIIPATFEPTNAPYQAAGSGQFESSMFTGIDNQLPVVSVKCVVIKDRWAGILIQVALR